MAENNIRAEGHNVPRPVTTFEESGLPRYLIDSILANPKFQKPSAIQAQAWPVALQGRDVFGIAQTGSGKTLAFILPAIVHVMAQPEIKVTKTLHFRFTFNKLNAFPIHNCYYALGPVFFPYRAQSDASRGQVIWFRIEVS